MLDYSELTVVKNTSGTPTALGYPINSFLLQNNKALFAGGGGKKKDKGDEEHDYDNLAVPAGLVCMTKTVCTRQDANETSVIETEETELVPEGLYERLLELAETKVPKKMTRRAKPAKKENKKTHKRK